MTNSKSEEFSNFEKTLSLDIPTGKFLVKRARSQRRLEGWPAGVAAIPCA
jgi:hypothetical protein